MNVKPKIKISLFLIFMVLVSFSLSQASQSEGAYILVKLRNGKELKFQYSTFKLNWKTFKVTDEVTCEVKEIDSKLLKRIFFLTESWNSCKKKDDYLFDIHAEGAVYQGFCSITSNKVKGVLKENLQLTEIPYQKIEEIVFYR